ncbi:MAG: FeoA family protein [Cyanobacteria bacterium J06639_18]
MLYQKFKKSKFEIDEEKDINQESENQSFSVLRNAAVGDRLWIVKITDKAVNSSILAMGLVPGTELEIISETPSGSIIISIGNMRIGLDADITEKIIVTHQPLNKHIRKERKIGVKKRSLADLQINQTGRFIQYQNLENEKYKHKQHIQILLKMGLTPGTTFKVISIPKEGLNPEVNLQSKLVKIEVQNSNEIVHIGISKEEASLIFVEEIQ